MRSYSYCNPDGAAAIFGGHFDFEVRAATALVLLADHLIPLTVSEIPTQIYHRFLHCLKPSDVLFVEFDAAEQFYRLIDFRWTETAGGYRYLSAAPLTRNMVCALGLASPRWSRVTNSITAASAGTTHRALSKV